MTKKNNLSAAVMEKSEFKRKFTLSELYCSLVFVPMAISKLSKNKKKGLVDKQFIERMQLAVTEVNGCAACSYKHTQMALQQGMSNEEISSFLNGSDTFFRTEEVKGIMFAQHFADLRGKPEKDAFESIVKEYGEEKADIILSAVQMMIAGNMYGIPFSAFLSRLQGKPYKKSTLFYELSMLILGVLFVPFALVHGYTRAIIGLPNKRFSNSTKQTSE